MEKISLKQRDIILVPFPFSDQTGQKIRPSLILSNDAFNRSGQDIIVCAITSQHATKHALSIHQSDLEEGILYEQSWIKVENIFKLNKALVIKIIGTLQKSSFNKVGSLLLELFK